jgi:hypothetical protein
MDIDIKIKEPWATPNRATPNRANYSKNMLPFLSNLKNPQTSQQFKKIARNPIQKVQNSLKTKNI